jgi:hypothetical protein
MSCEYVTPYECHFRVRRNTVTIFAIMSPEEYWLNLPRKFICSNVRLQCRWSTRPADKNLFARAHTTHYTWRTETTDCEFFFRFASQIFPVCNKCYLTDTTVTGQSYLTRTHKISYYRFFTVLVFPDTKYTYIYIFFYVMLFTMASR